MLGKSYGRLVFKEIDHLIRRRIGMQASFGLAAFETSLRDYSTSKEKESKDEMAAKMLSSRYQNKSQYQETLKSLRSKRTQQNIDKNRLNLSIMYTPYTDLDVRNAQAYRELTKDINGTVNQNTLRWQLQLKCGNQKQKEIRGKRSVSEGFSTFSKKAKKI